MSFLVSCQDINKNMKYRIPYVKKSRLSLFLLSNLLKGKKKNSHIKLLVLIRV